MSQVRRSDFVYQPVGRPDIQQVNLMDLAAFVHRPRQNLQTSGMPRHQVDFVSISQKRAYRLPADKAACSRNENAFFQPLVLDNFKARNSRHETTALVAEPCKFGDDLVPQIPWQNQNIVDRVIG